ncbi:RHM1 [Symbiodinium pilosum]|uniref:RHM1 protein n=1 Tax=Symbiodinium pilosum TaxID=2952 RepID=A0A812WEY8_SYMPI|nr:RHM1 [Symbiodinium pilosum]
MDGPTRAPLDQIESNAHHVLEYRLDIDSEYQGWILIFTTLTCAWLFCLPCYCAGMSSPGARRMAAWISQRLPYFYTFMTLFNALLMYLVIQWLPNWTFTQYLGVLAKSAGWTFGHVLKWATSLAMIIAFGVVVAFKERIALMLGLDHKQLFNCKAKDCLNCWSTARFRPIELLIWKVEDLASSDLFHANHVFVEAYMGYNETMRTRVHNNAGSDCILKESMQLNFDEDDEDEKLFLFVQNQKVMGAQELARVEVSSASVKDLLKDSEKLRGPQQVMQWDANYFPKSFPLIPRGQIWISAVPVEDEYQGYAELTGC